MTAMNPEVTVRPATLADAPGVQKIHENCDDPWGESASCAIWLNHRLLRGFLIDVALVDDEVAGHAEWIISAEPPPAGRHLYLGMIQVRSDFQRRGIGRAMLNAGIEKAVRFACPSIQTVPEGDAKPFYTKCGFAPRRAVVSYSVEVPPTRLSKGWRRVRTVPSAVVGSLPMRCGLVQGASAHMWEICNRPVKLFGEREQRPCARRSDGKAYVQLRYLGDESGGALALAWAETSAGMDELVQAASACAHGLPVETLKLTVGEEEASACASWPGAVPAGAGEIWGKTVHLRGDAAGVPLSHE